MFVTWTAGSLRLSKSRVFGHTHYACPLTGRHQGGIASIRVLVNSSLCAPGLWRIAHTCSFASICFHFAIESDSCGGGRVFYPLALHRKSLLASARIRMLCTLWNGFIGDLFLWVGSSQVLSFFTCTEYLLDYPIGAHSSHWQTLAPTWSGIHSLCF